MFVSLTLCAVCLSGLASVKTCFLATWARGLVHVLFALPATLRKDLFIERPPGITAQPQVLEWDGRGSVIRLFWSGVTYLRGKRGG